MPNRPMSCRSCLFALKWPRNSSSCRRRARAESAMKLNRARAEFRMAISFIDYNLRPKITDQIRFGWTDRFFTTYFLMSTSKEGLMYIATFTDGSRHFVQKFVFHVQLLKWYICRSIQNVLVSHQTREQWARDAQILEGNETIWMWCEEGGCIDTREDKKMFSSSENGRKKAGKKAAEKTSSDSAKRNTRNSLTFCFFPE